MMNVQLIVLGKLKEKYMKDFSNEYEKRISGFCKLTVTELEPVRLSDNPSEKEIQNALKKETALIKEKMLSNAFIFSMCIEGKELSSEELSRKIENIGISGQNNIVFIIGSSFGLSEEIKKDSGFRLSMSPMTFPHKLARIMLLEQIYRAFSISHGGKYHK
ncbi:MAG: 23S rRNA (pseudouridine(1915)-N(3))-methyltransferase RlmH [Oscillospiraceae bacterium]|nr:23S rRNA (pseudouridine(1915)-N(3))-methyltransferase RlmH [Oscillospiraceae bacterium]